MQVRISRPAVFLLLATLATFAFLFSGVTTRAERVEDLPKPKDYVSDFAHVLSPETVARMDRLCSQLDHGKANAQVAIVTVRNLNGDDKADFANRLEEKWKVGRKGSDRGILMLVSVDDHHYWIEVGYGLEGILPDGKVGDIGRAMVPYLKAHDFDSGLTTGLVQIANVIAVDAKVTLEDSSPEEVPAPVQPRRTSSGGGFIFRIVIILIVLAFFGIRGLFGFGLGMFLGGGRGGWGGGGGFGGGGGDSGGGGFGGFGGGDSGGGGAGGDF